MISVFSFPQIPFFYIIEKIYCAAFASLSQENAEKAAERACFFAFILDKNEKLRYAKLLKPKKL